MIDQQLNQQQQSSVVGNNQQILMNKDAMRKIVQRARNSLNARPKRERLIFVEQIPNEDYKLMYEPVQHDDTGQIVIYVNYGV